MLLEPVMKHNTQAIFISHGGGPMPLLGDKGHEEMVISLKKLAKTLPKPKAIIVISAHWEASVATITSATHPELIYDYYGFPKESYEIGYPCHGAPDLANDIFTALTGSGIESKLDATRGFDHGLFVPLTIMYPEADIPCVQLSLVNTLDPAHHIKMGQALNKVEHEGLLIIGSGFSFHNMNAFFAPNTAQSISQNEAFESWLVDTCSNTQLTEFQRKQRLINWGKAPSARYCHPREEHLLPLHVCYGLTETACNSAIELQIVNKKSSMYLWE
jgi:aromatic ring-opening dioxygenase catalytic subunit (LigB family)